MEWIGTLRVSTSGETVVVMLRETPQTVLYRTLYAPPNVDVKSFLYSYFQLLNPPSLPTSCATLSDRVSLADLYQEWSKQCDRLRRVAECIPGVRIIDQDPWECLVSFLCSSNNNIPRITKMLNAIRRRYGDPVLRLSRDDLGDAKHIVGADASDHDSNDCVTFYSFPSLVQLYEKATETDLRTHCGMGYRAKYLMETMNMLTELGGEKYLHDLRNINDPIVVQEKLIQFCGVGRKVADCIALFSLHCPNAVPVDVHVWNIARRDYGADALRQASKSLTPTVYHQIGDLFRSRFPTRAGWAHSLLFVAELPSFRGVMPPDLVEEMDQVRTTQAHLIAGSTLGS
jgi:N-glycosylase/DNA lyase